MTTSLIIRLVIGGIIGWYIGGEKRKRGWSWWKTLGISTAILVPMNIVTIFLLGV